MNFGAEGPFELKRHGPKKLINKDAKEALRADLGLGLSDACGCYVFAVRAGKGYTPYYVGRAEKSSILNESLNPSNIGKYNDVMRLRARRTTVQERWRRPSGGRGLRAG